MSEWVTAFAPASIGNVAVGFDMLGLALEGVGDRVRARRVDGDGVVIGTLGQYEDAPPALAPFSNTLTASDLCSTYSSMISGSSRVAARMDCIDFQTRSSCW